MKTYSGLAETEPTIRRYEQTVSTAPSQLPDALASLVPQSETNATSGSFSPRAVARQLVLVVALSAMSMGAQPVTLPLLRRHEIVTGAESSQNSVDPAIVEQIRQIFARGASEFFEDGRDSNFAQELLDSVREFGNAAVDALSEYLFSSTANADVASEALKRLGEVRDRRVQASRWALLQRGLRHKSSRVRDGAILGFASLDDRRALDILKDIEAEERVPELRNLIHTVIKQLGTSDGEAAAQS